MPAISDAALPKIPTKLYHLPPLPSLFAPLFGEAVVLLEAQWPVCLFPSGFLPFFLFSHSA